ncbi:probable G-protein coupled receptor 139 [Heterodontus francisci]|uniref:probable G-protein coupled receptor 139 n=1 Tax=Heterodontus francisci TaxID=7792 RepID=UPI00355C39A7
MRAIKVQLQLWVIAITLFIILPDDSSYFLKRFISNKVIAIITVTFQHIRLLHLIDYFPVVLCPTANLMTAVILSRGKCGLSRGITRYMVAMAISDLLVMIFLVLLYQIFSYHFPSSFLSLTAICPSYAYLRIVTLDYSVWLTVSFTFDRFISICCQKLRLRYCTERTAAVVIVSMFVLSCLKFIPYLFMYESKFMMDNLWWGCKIKTVFFTSAGWVTFAWICSLSVSFLPFILILLLNGLTVKHILAASRVRRVLKGLGSGQNQSDSEMENRQKSIILLFAVSGSYILLWMTGTVTFICTRITFDALEQNLTSPGYIASDVGRLLILMNSCANTCIYGLTQSKFREEVKKAVKYLLTRVTKLMNLKLQSG